jgi:ankyrin repeat protein
MQRLVRDEGADVNRETGKPLENAVVENSLEKVKYLLDLGASPNLRQRSEATINKAKSLDMIKLLVNKGAELTSTVFKNIMEDTGAVEYCLKAGMDPNFENKLPIRTCCKMGSLDTLKLLIKYGADMTHNRSMPMAWAAENARKDFMEYMIDRGVTTGFAHVKRWIQHTTRFGDDAKGKAIKADMEKYINDLIKSGRVRE